MQSSIIENLMNKHIEEQKRKEIVIERMEDYKTALNRVAATNEGKLLLKYMVRFAGLFSDPPQLNPAQLIEDRGRRAYYLKMIRPYLEKKFRKEIENYD